MTKILFIQVGRGFEYPNKHIISQFKSQFSGCEVVVYDVMSVIRKDYWFLFCNALYMVNENFIDYITGRKNIFKSRLHFLGTTFIFNKFSKLVREQLVNDQYDFIFQTQGLCDSKNEQGIPFYIYTDHTNLNNLNYTHIKGSQFLRSKKYIELERKAYENAECIFVMSLNIRDSLVRQYQINGEKIKLVYVSTNTPVVQKINSEKYKNKNILFVGKDWVRKGGPLLVEAFKIVQTRVADAKLTIVGCNPKIELQNCFVLGEQSLENVGEIYNQASIFCMPTLREPFGIVFLEAMFNRLPVVTNRVGATPYLVKEEFNGYLLNNDATEYAEALIALLTDSDKCERFGNNSYEMASKTYTWENVVSLMKEHIVSGNKS